MSARDLPRCVNEAAGERNNNDFFNESRAEHVLFCLAMRCVCLRARKESSRRSTRAMSGWISTSAEKASGAANYHTLQTAVTLISLSRLITHSSRPSSLITVIVLLFFARCTVSLSHLWRQVAKFIWRTRRLMRLSPPAPSLAADNAFIRLLARERVIWQGRIAD